MNLWGRGERAAALALSAKRREAQPDDENVALFHSGLLLHQGDFQQACELLEGLVAAHPTVPGLRVNLSIARRGCGDLEAARQAAESAVAGAPELASAWNALGIALIELGLLDEAERRLSEGLARHPDNAALSLHLDQVIGQQGKKREGEDAHGLALLSQAETLMQSGNAAAAETLLRQAVRLYPDHAAPYTNLGSFLKRFERYSEAAEAFRAALARNPGCETSRYFLELVEGRSSDTGSASYTRRLFDAYAERFDQHLVETLEYRVPDLLAELILAAFPDGEIGEVLDLGCGTGLMAERLAGRVVAIDGVDLSPRMLEKARERGLYRSLVEGDIREYLAAASGRWQLVMAADVFCYCGRLDDIFALTQSRLQPGGLLAFTVEASHDSDVEIPALTGRYRHGHEYLRASLSQAGFDHCRIDQAILRKDRGEDVPGYLVTARC